MRRFLTLSYVYFMLFVSPAIAQILPAPPSPNTVPAPTPPTYPGAFDYAQQANGILNAIACPGGAPASCFATLESSAAAAGGKIILVPGGGAYSLPTAVVQSNQNTVLLGPNIALTGLGWSGLAKSTLVPLDHLTFANDLSRINASEIGLSVQGVSEGASNVGNEKDALRVDFTQSQASSYSGGVCTTCLFGAAVSVYTYMGAGNTTGVVYGYGEKNYIPAGTDGYALNEFSTANNATADQGSYQTATTKYDLHLAVDPTSTNPVTAGMYVSGTLSGGAAGYHDAIGIAANAVSRNIIGDYTVPGTPTAANTQFAIDNAGNITGNRYTNSPLAAKPVVGGVNCTGLGTGGTCALMASSSEVAGTILLTAGSASTGTAGIVDITFSPAYGSNHVDCLYNLHNGSGTWNARATSIGLSDSTTISKVQWDNNSVSLTTGASYRINYLCFGE